MVNFEKLATIYSTAVAHRASYGIAKSHLALALREIFPWLSGFDVVPDGPMRLRATAGEKEQVFSRSALAREQLQAWILEYTRKEFGK